MFCPTCLRYRQRDTLTTDGKQALVQRLSRLGFRGVSISGGEPFLDRGLPKIVASAKASGLYVGISTNATILHKQDWSQFDGLDELSFSIDGSTAELQAYHRASPTDLPAVIAAIGSAGGQPFNLIVGTVLTRANMSDLQNILDLVRRVGIRRWKINRFCPTGDGATHRAQFEISDDAFARVAETLSELPAIRYGDVSVVLKDSSEAVMKSSVNISPDGRVMLFDAGTFLSVGSVWTLADIHPLLAAAGFRYDIHSSRGFRGQYEAGSWGSAAGGWAASWKPGSLVVVTDSGSADEALGRRWVATADGCR